MSPLDTHLVSIVTFLPFATALGLTLLRRLPESEVIARTTARLHVARAFRVTGDVSLAAERQAAAAVGPIRASGNLLATLTAVMNLARLQALQGRLRAAAATYGEVLELAGGPDGLRGVFGSMPYYAGLGDLHREWNELDPRAHRLIGGRSHGQHERDRDCRRCHGVSGRDTNVRRNSCLNFSNVPNAIASLTLCMVSR